MTGAERAKAHRARKLGKDEVGLKIVPPGDALLKAWWVASESERRALLDAILPEVEPDPMETPVLRSKPSQRFTAPVGSLLKAAK